MCVCIFVSPTTRLTCLFPLPFTPFNPFSSRPTLVDANRAPSNLLLSRIKHDIISPGALFWQSIHFAWLCCIISGAGCDTPQLRLGCLQAVIANGIFVGRHKVFNLLWLLLVMVEPTQIACESRHPEPLLASPARCSMCPLNVCSTR